MAYKLIITKKATALFDDLVYYLINKLKNYQAAKHFSKSVRSTYKRIQDNPYQFPQSNDPYLLLKGYHEAPLSDMRYIILYRVQESTVHIEGIYHELELYSKKMDN